VIRKDKLHWKDRVLPLGGLSFYRLFARDLRLDWGGNCANETLSLSVNLSIDLPPDLAADRYKYVVCYDRIVTGAKSFAADRDLETLEELADRIVEHCLADSRVRDAEVALSPVVGQNLGHGGCEIYRRRNDTGEVISNPLKITVGN
jgi:dihydroneopterin aldolase